jgi:catechol 2,3-dioxygenase-like lactoylglutathione lyase family enzyme
MSRVQLALNVSDLDAAVEYYSKLFDTTPAKRRPGYANFAIADPPLKLVLVEGLGSRGKGVPGALNHLGVEVETADQVASASRRLSAQGLATADENETTCCFALQDEVWTEDPDALAWETPCWPMRPRRRGAGGGCRSAGDVETDVGSGRCC